jgi:hypothetical protein
MVDDPSAEDEPVSVVFNRSDRERVAVHRVPFHRGVGERDEFGAFFRRLLHLDRDLGRRRRRTGQRGSNAGTDEEDYGDDDPEDELEFGSGPR